MFVFSVLYLIFFFFYFFFVICKKNLLLGQTLTLLRCVIPSRTADIEFKKILLWTERHFQSYLRGQTAGILTSLKISLLVFRKNITRPFEDSTSLVSVRETQHTPIVLFQSDVWVLIIQTLFRNSSPRRRTALSFCLAPTTRSDPTTSSLVNSLFSHCHSVWHRHYYVIESTPKFFQLLLMLSFLDAQSSTHCRLNDVCCCFFLFVCRSAVWLSRARYDWTWNWQVCLSEWY